MIAILMATYNGEKYIEEQLDSILQQTYSDTAVFIHDDGSTDGTIDIVKKYTEKYPEMAEDICWFFENAEQMAVPRPAVWQELHRLKNSGYHLYLLSNYSSVLFEKHVGRADFHRDLDGRIVSFEVHTIKPDPDIYQTLFSEYGLKPEECLYFDDLQENVDASRLQGMDARRVASEKELLKLLEEL